VLTENRHVSLHEGLAHGG